MKGNQSILKYDQINLQNKKNKKDYDKKKNKTETRKRGNWKTINESKKEEGRIKEEDKQKKKMLWKPA